MPRGIPLNLVGRRFDKLTVVALHAGSPSGRLWRCRCACGAEIIKMTTQLRRGGRIGCRQCERLSRSDAATDHGGCKFGKSRIYKTWKGMRSRCECLGAASWPYYGARGIKVCEEWQSFVHFRSWALSHGYQDHLSIDRLNPNGDYEPSNCEWVTRSENSRRMHKHRRKAA